MLEEIRWEKIPISTIIRHQDFLQHTIQEIYTQILFKLDEGKSISQEDLENYFSEEIGKETLLYLASTGLEIENVSLSNEIRREIAEGDLEKEDKRWEILEKLYISSPEAAELYENLATYLHHVTSLCIQRIITAYAGVETPPAYPTLPAKKKLEFPVETPAKKPSLKKLFFAASTAISLLTGSALAYVANMGYQIHSSPENLAKAIEKNLNSPPSTFWEKAIMELTATDPKDYPVMSYALKHGASPETAAKLYPLEKTKAGMRWLIEQSFTKSQVRETITSRYFQQLVKNCPIDHLSKNEIEFIDIFISLPREKQEIAAEFVKDGMIAPSDVYAIKLIKQMPVKKVRKLYEEGNIYPQPNIDGDPIPDLWDIQPDKPNKLFAVFYFPCRDPHNGPGYLVFDDPQERAWAAQKMDRAIKAFETFDTGERDFYAYRIYNASDGKLSFLKTFDEIAKEAGKSQTPSYLLVVINSHGDKDSVWMAGSSRGGPEDSLRKYFLHADELVESINEIYEKSGKPLIVSLCVDACDGNEFVNRTCSKLKTPYAFGLGLPGALDKLDPMQQIECDYDRNRVVDSHELLTYHSKTLPEMLRGNETAFEKYFFLPIDRETKEKFSEWVKLDMDNQFKYVPESWAHNYSFFAQLKEYLFPPNNKITNYTKTYEEILTTQYKSLPVNKQ